MMSSMKICMVGTVRQSMRASRCLALAASLLLLAACANTNTVAPGQGAATSTVQGAPAQVALPGTYEFPLRSAQGKDYRIFVALPQGEPPAAGYPVLYLLDGNAYFTAAAAAMREQSAFAGMSGVQGVIVVGVGYPGEGLLDRERRTLDFLPPSDGSNPSQSAMLGAPPGGADAFLGFLVDELRPALAARHRIDPVRQSLAGHSLGGYFALHALLHRPAAFRSYAAISPSIWVDNGRLLKEATAQAASLKAPLDVFLAVSPEEIPGRADFSAIMLSTARSMNAILAPTAAQGVRTRFQELPGENHISTNLAAMSAILRQASGAP
jgi:predicted alpha/beta superfamily hydrolase